MTDPALFFSSLVMLAAWCAAVLCWEWPWDE